MPFAPVNGQRIRFDDSGGHGPPVILSHGFLMDREMFAHQWRALADAFRVITWDQRGFGETQFDLEPFTYWDSARDCLGLLDHLGIDQAVVGGPSLGANSTLEVASQAPERLRGMIVEMPVLDNALLAAAVAFCPLLVATTAGAPVARLFSRAMRLVPNRRLPFLLDIGVEVLQRDPAPTAALLQGLFFGRVAPHRTERRTFTAPTLVIGHRRDPIHPLSDAGMLADELPNGRLLEADSIIELRRAPRRLTNEIADFVERCWKPVPAARRARRRAAGS